MADYTLSAKLTADARDLIKGFQSAKDSVEDAGKSIQNTSKNMAATGAKMSIGVTAPLLAAGKAIIGTGMVFDDSMAKVAAVSGATGDDLQRLRDTAKDMGATTRYSASEAADGLNYMAMAGWTTEQMISGLPGVLSLAAASGADLATTSDIVTDAMTAFGLEAKDSGKFADVLAAASSKANTDVVMLGESFKYVAPLAGTLGYSAEDTSVALGLMANSGIKASQAGTSLKTMLANLASPTSKMQGAMDDLGISLTNSDGSMKTLDEVMGNLQTSFAGLDEQQQAAAASTIFGKEAMAGALSIINTSAADYDKLSDAVYNSEGAAKTMADTMENTLGGKMRALGSAVEGVSIQFYEELLPSLNAIADKVQSAVGFIAGMSGESKRLTLVIAGIAAAVGPLLIGLGTMGFIMGGVVTAIGMMLSPIGLVIAGIAALGIAVGLAMIKSESFRDTVTGAFDTISNVIGGIVSTIAPILQNLWSGALDGANSFADGLGGKLLGAFETVKSVVMTVVGVIGHFVSAIVDGFSGAGGSVSSLSALFLGFNPILKIAMMIFTQFGPQIMAGFQQIAALVVPILTTLGTMLGQLAATVIPIVMGIVMELIAIIVELGGILFSTIISLLPIVMNLFNSLVPIIMMVVQQLGAIISTIVPLVANLVKSLFPAISMIAQVLMNIVTSVAPAFIAIVGLIGSALAVLLPIASSILQAIIHLVTNIIKVVLPLVGFIGGVISAIVAIIAPIITFIAGVMSSIFQLIRPIVDVVTGVFNIVMQVISDVWQRIMTFTGGIFVSIGTIISGLSGIVSGVFNAIFGTISSVMNNVSRTITGVFEAIRGAWTGLTTFVDSIFNGISSNMQKLVGQVKGFVNGVIGGINSAVSLINKIPGVNINQIPYLARGTDDWEGGLARINEGGRGELVNLPNGAQVIPHDVSMKYAREAGQASSRQGERRQQTAPAMDMRPKQPLIVQSVLNGRVIAEEMLPDISRGLAWEHRKASFFSGNKSL